MKEPKVCLGTYPIWYVGHHEKSSVSCNKEPVAEIGRLGQVKKEGV